MPSYVYATLIKKMKLLISEGVGESGKGWREKEKRRKRYDHDHILIIFNKKEIC